MLASSPYLLLSSNRGFRISNPLGGIPKDVLMADVASFAEEVGMTEQTSLLQKGALIAQNPGILITDPRRHCL